MEPKQRQRRSFDRDFKRQAIRLVLEDGKSCRSVERDLGLSEGTVYKWVRQGKDDPDHCFPGKGHLKPSDADFRKILRENDLLRRERDILKKALAIFSKPRLKNTVL
jgi:transposase